MKNINLRYAVKEDVPRLLELTKGLAVHENAPNAVIATEAQLEEWLFKKKWAEVMVGEYEEKIVGMSLFYQIFPAYLGRGGLFIDTLFVEPDYRGMGFGKMLFKKMAETALERGRMRLEWNCLDDNISSVQFYEHMGGTALKGCSIYRATGDALRNIDEK